MHSRIYMAEAVVVRRISIGETDRVVTLFTRDKGKLNAIAKGARRPLSKLGGGSEPFTYSRVQLAVGQNLDVLTQVQVINAFPQLRRDLTLVGYASYFLEVIDVGVVERQPAPELWDLLVGALTILEVAPRPDILARAFELAATSLLGYEPQLQKCVRCSHEVTDAGAVFHPLRGGALCGRCAYRAPGGVPVSPEALLLMRRIASVPLLEAQRLPISDEACQEMARCLIPYVRHRLEAPLKSLEFLLDVTAPAPQS